MKKYHPLLVTLHWMLAIMVLIALFMGSQFLAPTPNSDPEKLNGLFGHMIAGMLILVLMLVRLVIRFTTQKPAAADTGNSLLNLAGKLAHWALYIVVIGMAASGLALANMAGLPDIVFFGSGETLPADFNAFGPRAAHGILAKILFALIILHVLAALYHQFFLKDNLFGRMWFGKRG